MSEIVLDNNSLTLVLNGSVISDLAIGDKLVITPVNPKTSRMNHHTHTTIQSRGDSDVHDITINYIKYSDSDEIINSWLNSPTPLVFAGSIKENYQKSGVARISSYELTTASFTTQPTNTHNDQDGNDVLSITLQARMIRLI